MSRYKKTLATIVFALIISGLKYWLGFETMVTVVIVTWFTTIIDNP